MKKNNKNFISLKSINSNGSSDFDREANSLQML